MPITVRYQPPAELLSRAAYVAGAGQYAQDQQRLAMQQQEAEANRRLREQQLQLQAIGQQFDIQRAQQADAIRQQAVDQQAARDQLEFQASAMRNQAYLKQIEQNDPARRAESLWHQASAKAIDDTLNTTRAKMSGLKLNPDGDEIRRGLKVAYANLMRERSKMRPAAYVEAAGKWIEMYESSGLDKYIQPPPTPQEMAAKRSHRIDDHNMMVFDENGRPSVQRLQPPPAPAKSTSVQVIQDHGPVLPFEQWARRNQGAYLTKVAAARKELLEEAKAKTPVGEVPKIPSRQEAIDRVREDYQTDLRTMTAEPYAAPMVNPAAIGVQTIGDTRQMPVEQVAEEAQPTAVWRYENGQLIRVK